MKKTKNTAERSDTARALSASERKILRVWADPAYYASTDTECIKAAGVGRATYYKAKQTPALEGERQRICREMLVQGLRGAYGAMIETAGSPGREGFQDRRLLMEMAGEYTPRQAVSADVTHHKPAAPIPAPETCEDWQLQTAARAAKRLDRTFGNTGGSGGNGNRIPEEAPDAV